MKILKYVFCIATNKHQSEYKQIVELSFDEDLTDEEIEDQVEEIYTEWLLEKNQGSYNKISE